jgi:hypothetical protein
MEESQFPRQKGRHLVWMRAIWYKLLLFQSTLRIIEMVVNGYEWFLLPLDIYRGTNHDKP